MSRWYSGSVYEQYHAGLQSPMRQTLYDRVGITELARLAQRIENDASRAVVAEALAAKCERLELKMAA